MKISLQSKVLAARKMRKWDQVTLAKKAGVPQCQISRIENGADCLVSTLEKIAKALEIELW